MNKADLTVKALGDLDTIGNVIASSNPNLQTPGIDISIQNLKITLSAILGNETLKNKQAQSQKIGE